MNKTTILMVLVMLFSVTFVAASEVSNSYKGLTPCELSMNNYNYGFNFWNPIRIPNKHCEEGTIKPRGIHQIKWDFWHNHIY